MKKIRHYKRLDSALKRLLREWVFIEYRYDRVLVPLYGTKASGGAWLDVWGRDSLKDDMDKPCSAEYDSRENAWTVTIRIQGEPSFYVY